MLLSRSDSYSDSLWDIVFDLSIDWDLGLQAVFVVGFDLIGSRYSFSA